MPPVFRFAPSPNGRLHRGHAYSALLNADLACRSGGRFLLRIEDIDTIRCRPDLERGIMEDLRWLGLAWEEPVRRQSEHFDDYRSAFAALRGRGLAYPCFCSRRQIAEAVAAGEAGEGAWPRDPDGSPLYPRTCRRLTEAEIRARLAAGEPHGWRLAMDRALIVRKDTPTSYHLSVVVDDALQGVTHVVRGTDLEAATDLHVLLQALLGLPKPLYHHHPLIRDGTGGKLSKSLGSEALADLRSRGVTPAAVRESLGFGTSESLSRPVASV
jgi:glutamyl-Q tRNA(Asp) synthetase